VQQHRPAGRLAHGPATLAFAGISGLAAAIGTFATCSGAPSPASRRTWQARSAKGITQPRPKANHPGATTVRFRSRDVLSFSGMRRSTLLELSGMELHEVAHVRRCFAGELAHGVRHAVVTPLPVQLGHGREMPDKVLRKLRLA
jgi:hypothetical protein